MRKAAEAKAEAVAWAESGGGEGGACRGRRAEAGAAAKAGAGAAAEAGAGAKAGAGVGASRTFGPAARAKLRLLHQVRYHALLADAWEARTAMGCRALSPPRAPSARSPRLPCGTRVSNGARAAGLAPRTAVGYARNPLVCHLCGPGRMLEAIKHA